MSRQSNPARYDELDSDVIRAVMAIRRHHNISQRLLNLAVTDHTYRDPFEQRGKEVSI